MDEIIPKVICLFYQFLIISINCYVDPKFVAQRSQY